MRIGEEQHPKKQETTKSNTMATSHTLTNNSNPNIFWMRLGSKLWVSVALRHDMKEKVIRKGMDVTLRGWPCKSPVGIHLASPCHSVDRLSGKWTGMWRGSLESRMSNLGITRLNAGDGKQKSRWAPWGHCTVHGSSGAWACTLREAESCCL